MDVTFQSGFRVTEKLRKSRGFPHAPVPTRAESPPAAPRLPWYVCRSRRAYADPASRTVTVHAGARSGACRGLGPVRDGLRPRPRAHRVRPLPRAPACSAPTPSPPPTPATADLSPRPRFSRVSRRRNRAARSLFRLASVTQRCPCVPSAALRRAGARFFSAPSNIPSSRWTTEDPSGHLLEHVLVAAKRGQ